MDKIIFKSKNYFNEGYGCAEAVLKAVAEHQNIKSNVIPRIATGLCGGMARTDGMCGAVSGGILALSLVHGRDNPGEDRTLLVEKIQEFIKSFTTRYGTTGCTGLTGCDLSTHEGEQKFNELDMHLKCTEFVGEATRLVLTVM